jgi:NADH-quinone oxidoreductase subunit L
MLPTETASGQAFGVAVTPAPSAISEFSSATRMPHQIALVEQRKDDAGMARILALASAALGLGIALLLFLFRPGWSGALKRVLRPIYVFSYRGWFFDALYDFAIVDTTVLTARLVAWTDRRIVDGMVNFAGKFTVLLSRIAAAFDRYAIDGIVTLTGATVQFFGLMFRSIQTGRVQTYLTWVIAAVVVLLVILRFSLFH